jgi:flagellar FliJ protein
MKNNKYSLENILKIRHDKEDKKLNEMSLLLNQYLEDIETEKKMIVDIEKTIYKMNSEKISNIRNQKSYYLYLEKLRFELDEQKRAVKQAERDYEEKKKEYIEAQMDRKVIEKHKERYVETINLEIKKNEELMLDELAIVSFNRRKCQ